ncbi:nuclear transport factor 2-like protein [Hymenobacter terricola]|uniref:hypothetical protein n=1 Tax=Hymenobacter terricola TaxID=2819236 RepID=UPI001B312C81|nr:hypothetical protein [Hymenobacter terricola]
MACTVGPYLQEVLPQVAQALDFSRFSFESLTAEDDRVVAVINVGVLHSKAMLMVSEHWVIQGEKAISLWVAYYEPKALLEQLESSSTSFSMLTHTQL